MDAKQVADRYIETWNETDPAARLTLMESLWAEGASYVDPLTSLTGQDEISEFIGGIQSRVPGHEFRLLDGVDAHHDVLRFGWELVPADGGEPLAIGFDVAVTKGDGRITNLIGFLDKAPAGI
jgi:SnoaL-like domain